MAQSIRIAASAHDFEHLAELLVEYEASLDEDLKHANFGDELPVLQSAYGAPNLALIACVDDKPAGCIAFQRLDACGVVIKKMYVRPEFRGLGIAKSLLTELVQLARARGYTRAVLDTDRTRLAAAYELYRSFGFTECEPYGPVDYAYPTYMELPL